MIRLLSCTFYGKELKTKLGRIKQNISPKTKPVWNLTPLAHSREFVVYSITLKFLAQNCEVEFHLKNAESFQAQQHAYQLCFQTADLK